MGNESERKMDHTREGDEEFEVKERERGHEREWTQEKDCYGGLEVKTAVEGIG